MRFVVDKQTLSKPLQQLVALVDRRAVNPALQCAWCQPHEGALQVRVSDLDKQLDVHIPGIDVEGEAKPFLLPVRKTWDICRHFDDKASIVFDMTPEQVRIHSGGSRFDLKTLPPDAYPKLTPAAAPQVVCTLPGPDIRTLLESVLFAVSDQDLRVYLHGMLWDMGANGWVVVGADGHRLAQSSWRCTVTGSGRFVLPRTAVLDLMRILPTESSDEVRIELHTDGVALHMSNRVFSAKLIQATYPDQRRLLDQPLHQHAAWSVLAWRQALTRMLALTSSEQQVAALHFEDQLLRLVSESAGSEQGEEHIPMSYQGEAKVLHLNMNYCLEFLNTLPSHHQEITCAFSEPTKPVLFQGCAELNTQYLLMPYRR